MQTMTATTARVKTIHHYMTCGTAAAAAIQNTKMGENENESKHKNIHAQTKGIHTENRRTARKTMHRVASTSTPMKPERKKEEKAMARKKWNKKENEAKRETPLNPHLNTFGTS